MKAVYWFTIYLLMGILLVIAPYALNFTANIEAFWNSLAVGVLLILVSLIGMYIERERRQNRIFRMAHKEKPLERIGCRSPLNLGSYRPSVGAIVR